MRNILHFDTLDSTQTYLKTHFNELDDQTVVVTGTQTAGRGRFERTWVSQPGGLYFSLLLKPHKTDFLPNLTQLMALCVCQAAEKCGLTPNLKWPNDVQVAGRKLCGILSEAVTQHGRVACLILGVGVNVAQADLSAVGQPAVSLKELGVNVTKEDFLQHVLDLFFQNYLAVVKNGFAAISAAYKKRFPLMGKPITVKNGAALITGTAHDLSAQGTLLVQTKDGLQEMLIGDLL